MWKLPVQIWSVSWEACLFFSTKRHVNILRNQGPSTAFISICILFLCSNEKIHHRSIEIYEQQGKSLRELKGTLMALFLSKKIACYFIVHFTYIDLWNLVYFCSKPSNLLISKLSIRLDNCPDCKILIPKGNWKDMHALVCMVEIFFRHNWAQLISK